MSVQPTCQTNEVLVIGAGIAGLAAARALMERSVDVQVIEAGEIAGGRAALAHERLGLELGPSFLHAGERNPLTPIARELGFELIPVDGPELCFGLGDPNTAGRAVLARAQELEARIEAEAERGNDVPAAELFIRRDEYDDLAQAMIGPLSMG